MSDFKAAWRIELNCECPNCEAYFDIIETPDFWYHNAGTRAGENDTERTRDVDVECPECEHEFKVDFEY